MRMTSKLIEHLYYLGADLGQRPSATSSERVASAYCLSAFEDAGLEVRAETFQGIRSLGRLYIPIAAGMLASALLGTTRKGSRTIGAAIGAVSLAAFYGEQTSRFRPLLKAVARTTSHNVVGILRPIGRVQRRVVVISHLDTPRAGNSADQRDAGAFRRNALMGIGASIAAMVGHFLPRRIRRPAAVASSVALAGGVGMLVQRELRGIEPEGANDNASGTAVLLALAEQLAEEDLIGTEVWFVATAGRQAGRTGMSAFLERNSRELDGAFFLGLDSVAGQGATVRWITQSGLLETLLASQELVGIAEETANEYPELKAEPGVWRLGLETDFAAVRGQRAMTIKALSADGGVPNWQSASDTFENADEDVLERSHRFALELIRRLDRSN